MTNLLHEFGVMRLHNMVNHFCLNIVGNIAELYLDELVAIQGAVDFPIYPFAYAIGTNQYHGMQMMRLGF